MKSNIIQTVAAGAGGSLFLILLYFLVLFLLTGDLRHPWEQFLLYKYWMGALILGFGIQVGLLRYILSGRHMINGEAKATVGSSAGVSGATMIVCCLHHGLDIFPFLGISALSLFLERYQTQILAFGVISNLAGISVMILMIKRDSCSFNPFGFKAMGDKV